MKKILLVVFALISVNLFSQIEVKEGSFHKIEGYVMLDKSEHLDDNDNPMALIMITTENISAEERARFTYEGNAVTYFDVHQREDGQTYLYISAKPATFIEIIHPDYGKTEYTFPFELCDYCGYEMIIRRTQTSSIYLEIKSVPNSAKVFINNEYYGETSLTERSLKEGGYELKLQKEGYEPIVDKITLKEGDTLKKEYTLYKYIVINTDRAGDEVYLGDKKIGVTPVKYNFLDGQHEIKVKRNARTLKKTINVVGETSHNDIDYDKSSVYGNNDTVSIAFPKMGSLMIKTEPSGANVYINGEKKGKTPFNIEDFEIGEYKLEIEKGNYILPMQTFTIKTNRTEVINKSLVPGKRITIKTDEDGDRIYIGKDYIGISPVTLNLENGEYEIKADRKGRVITKTINVTGNISDVVSLIFPKIGTLEISTEPSGASVYIDGEYYGQTPFVKNDVLVGEHEIRVDKDKYVDIRKKCKINEGETLSLRETLVLGKAIKIETDKADDKIFVDNEYVGLSPQTVKLSYGWHNIMARRSDGDESKVSFNVQQGKESAVKLIFGKDIKFVTDHNGDYVYIDNVSVGRTPCVVKVAYGTHDLMLNRANTILNKSITIKKDDDVDEFSFNLGREVEIKTTKEGDQVEINGEVVGKTPLKRYLNFDTYNVTIKRGQMKSDCKIEVKENGPSEFTLYHGPLVTFNSDKKGDVVFVDGKKQGKTPLELDLSTGGYTVKVKRNRKIDTKNLTISKGGQSYFLFYPTKETINEFNDNGVRFIAASLSSTLDYKQSYGMTFGAYKKVGWYMSFMSNFHFADLVDLCELTDIFDENGWYDYEKLGGKVFDSRHSASFGLMFRMGCFMYLKMGVGYGLYTKYSQSADDPFVYYDGYGEWLLSGGLQFNMKHCVISTEAITNPKFKTLELRLGLGFAWKKK